MASLPSAAKKHMEYGGPDGGNGGRGGHIVFEAAQNLNTLIDFRYTQHFRAPKGGNGAGSDRTGAGAEDVRIRVPLGTQILADDQETLLADLDVAGKEVTLCRGGDGGFGNTHYKSSTNRAPRKVTKGFPGEERWIWLRLKLIADAGLVGLPNAGKSTFLAASSAARPKIADYPFTTLHPQLGVIRLSNTEEFVLADIPGLIEGAHEGAGLGDRFLGHVERCAVLLHLVDGAAGGVVDAWRMVREETARLWRRPGRQAGADRLEQGGCDVRLAKSPPAARRSRAPPAARCTSCPAPPARACRRCCAPCRTRLRNSAPPLSARPGAAGSVIPP